MIENLVLVFNAIPEFFRPQRKLFVSCCMTMAVFTVPCSIIIGRQMVSTQLRDIQTICVVHRVAAIASGAIIFVHNPTPSARCTITKLTKLKAVTA